MAKVLAVCLSPEKGTPKRNAGRAEFVAAHGIKDDAHAGPGIRQVSLISHQKIEDFRARGAKVEDGAFGENLVVDAIDFRSLPVGTVLSCNDVLLEITRIGKECHNAGCAIKRLTGDCVMPREGIFAAVIEEGKIKPGDAITVL